MLATLLYSFGGQCRAASQLEYGIGTVFQNHLSRLERKAPHRNSDPGPLPARPPDRQLCALQARPENRNIQPSERRRQWAITNPCGWFSVVWRRSLTAFSPC
jgi:hypothetical protein